MGWVLAKPVRDDVDKLEEQGGLLNGKVKNQDAVVRMHAN